MLDVTRWKVPNKKKHKEIWFKIKKILAYGMNVNIPKYDKLSSFAI